jgi:hypothetical protein
MGGIVHKLRGANELPFGCFQVSKLYARRFDKLSRIAIPIIVDDFLDFFRSISPSPLVPDPRARIEITAFFRQMPQDVPLTFGVVSRNPPNDCRQHSCSIFWSRVKPTPGKFRSHRLL